MARHLEITTEHIRNTLEGLSTDDRVAKTTAGRMARGQERLRLLKKFLMKQHCEEATLSEEAKRATNRADSARDRVVKAQRALAVLTDKRD